MELQPDPSERRRFEGRMAIVFAATFVTVGVFNPFFPVWLKGKGLGADEIAVVMAAQIAWRVVVSPWVLRRADAARDRANVIIAAAAAAAGLINLLWFASGFWSILAATLLFASAWAPIAPLADSIALSGVRRFAIDYGRARLWGSMAFIAANVLSGFVLSRFGSAAILPTLCLFFAAGGAVMLLAPRAGRPRRRSALSALTLSLPPRPSLPRARWFEPAADLRAILPAMIAIALIQASHAAYYAFASIQWERLGYSGVSIGIFWAIGVTAEVLLFRHASRLVARLGPRRLLLLGGCAAVVRWTLSGFDLGFAGFAAVQATHALTFGATHLALQSVIVGAVAEERLGSAQGMSFAVQTTLMALATLACGPLFAVLGAHAFWLMALLGAAGLLLAAGASLPAPYPHNRLEGGDTIAPE